MKCPVCGYKETKVVDSRVAEDEVSIRRRRECESCRYRFTTFETVELKIKVAKRSGTEESYSRQKLMIGIQHACSKRNISVEQINDLIGQIEQEICSTGKAVIESSKIGEIVLKYLKKLDAIAYLRYASIFNKFGTLADFERELQILRNEN